MKTIFKTIIAFLAAAVAPVVMFYVISLLLLYGGASLQFLFGKTSLQQLLKINLSSVFFMVFLGVLLGSIALAITSGHILLLGIPAFLLGWRFQAIRWWSTLVVAFVIGAIPAAISVLVSVWSDSFNYPNYYAHADAFSPMIYIGLGAAMGILGAAGGLFGTSGGLAFWLVWRYWVQPDLLSYDNRTVHLSENVAESCL